MKRLLPVWLVLVLLLVACGGDSSPEEAAGLPTQMQLPTLTATLTASVTPLPPTPTATQTPVPTQTTPPTVAPTATAVTIPTATPAPTLTPPMPGAPPVTPVLPTRDSPFGALSLFDGDLVAQDGPAGVTALQAVDFVTPIAREGRPGLLWTAVTGSPEAGWLVEFYDEDADVIVSYLLLPEGELRRLARAAFGLMPGFPLERAQIIVDSDLALERAADDGPLPAGALAFELRSAGDDPAWVIAGDDFVALVPATTP